MSDYKFSFEWISNFLRYNTWNHESPHVIKFKKFVRSCYLQKKMYKCHHNHDNNQPKPSQETSPAASFWQKFVFPSNSLHRSTDNIKSHALVLVTHNTVKMQLKNWITGSTTLFIPSNYIPPPFLSPHMMPAVYPEQIRQYNLIKKDNLKLPS